MRVVSGKSIILLLANIPFHFICENKISLMMIAPLNLYLCNYVYGYLAHTRSCVGHTHFTLLFINRHCVYVTSSRQ